MLTGFNRFVIKRGGGKAAQRHQSTKEGACHDLDEADP
jgi:hypothetical protein